jgi:hypothetical protein
MVYLIFDCPGTLGLFRDEQTAKTTMDSPSPCPNHPSRRKTRTEKAAGIEAVRMNGSPRITRSQYSDLGRDSLS